MGIPESQLETWSHQGAVDTAKRTHESIRQAFKQHEWPENMGWRVYLQGSYRNSTNIRGNSDVDIVIEMISVFYSNLTEEERERLNLRKAPYTWDDFRAQVLEALTSHFGTAEVNTTGDKCLRLEAGSARLAADIIPGVLFQKYHNLKVIAKGLAFWTRNTRERIVNYPLLHLENGFSKNSEDHTNGWYKPTVRMFKNARDRIADDSPDLLSIFPSYFVECLLYNVVDSAFGNSFADTYVAVLNWLVGEWERTNFERFITQSGQHYLFGDSLIHWSKDHALDLITRLQQLWENWN